MNLAELYKTIGWNEVLLFTDLKDGVKKIKQDTYEFCYNDFIENNDDNDFEETVKDRIFVFLIEDDIPPYIHIYEKVIDGDTFYLNLKNSYTFTPTEEELKEISGWDYENEEYDDEE